MLPNKLNMDLFFRKMKTCALAASVLFFIIPATVLFSQEDSIYDAQGRRDPFIPLVTPDGRLLKIEKKEDAEALAIEGIIYDKYDLSYAVISGEVVKVGDAIAGYRVLKIEKNKVILIKDGQPMELELKEEQ